MSDDATISARPTGDDRDAADARGMARALEAGATVRRTVSPRPWVGAAVVGRDATVFAGATQGRRGSHAEVVALAAAGDAARGATLYVTLEPCSHHGTTGPCADAVIAAGIERVVVGVLDPDPQVSGKGVDRLRRAGLDVEVGVLADAVERQLAPYLTHRRTGRPYVVLKLAATLDGRTAAPDGTSRWITGAEARLDAHAVRADSDVIVVGAGTVRSDDPALTVRLPAGEFDGDEHRQPVRVVLGRAPAGAKVHPCEERDGPLEDLLEELGRGGALQVMVEGGATVAHAFHAAGLVDRYVLYLAPALMGGDDAPGLFHGAGAATLAGAWRGDIETVRQIGSDIRVDVVARRDEEGV